MSDEEIVVPQDLAIETATPAEPAAQPGNHTSETASEGNPQTPEQDEQETDEQDPDKDDGKKPEKMPWEQRAINRLNREKWEERRQKEAAIERATALENEIKSLRGEPRNPDEQQPKPPSQAEIDRQVQERAAQMLQAQSFDADCNKAYSSGVKELPGFEASVENLRLMGAMRPDVLNVVFKAAGDDAHKVLHQLGQDPDEADRILSLDPIRMAVALGKMADAPAKKPPISSAPPPIKPIAGSARHDPDEARLSDEAWWRKQQSR